MFTLGIWRIRNCPVRFSRMMCFASAMPRLVLSSMMRILADSGISCSLFWMKDMVRLYSSWLILKVSATVVTNSISCSEGILFSLINSSSLISTIIFCGCASSSLICVQILRILTELTEVLFRFFLPWSFFACAPVKSSNTPRYSSTSS